MRGGLYAARARALGKKARRTQRVDPGRPCRGPELGSFRLLRRWTFGVEPRAARRRVVPPRNALEGCASVRAHDRNPGAGRSVLAALASGRLTRRRSLATSAKPASFFEVLLSRG